MRPEVREERIRGAVLNAGTLARFAGGLGWPAILALTGGKRKAWWRCAVAEAEERGLLEWDRSAKVWRLTEAGRDHTRSVA